MVTELVSALKDAGAKPFIIPAMGSHGGATAEGQRDMLIRMEITEEYTGAARKLWKSACRQMVSPYIWINMPMGQMG